MSDIPKLDRKGLREFGLTTGAIVAGLFGLILPSLAKHALPIWPWVVAGVLCAWALIAPSSLNVVYQLWMRFGLVLGWINTRIILSVIFYIVVMPSGLLMRIFSKDPMHRKFERRLATYRVISKQPPREKMEKPF